MKALYKARVTFVTDEYLPDEKFKSPFKANVFVNGNAASINQGDVRVDRLTAVSVTTVKDPDGPKGAEVLEISGRSDYLRDMGLAEEDQRTTIRVKGGVCQGC